MFMNYLTGLVLLFLFPLTVFLLNFRDFCNQLAIFG